MAVGGAGDEAGRAAYLAGFQAAQGLPFKTHKGVQSEFARTDRPGGR